MLGHAATGNQSGALIQTDLYKVEHALTLALGNHRTHLRGFREGVSYLDAACFRRQFLHELLVDRALDQMPGGTDAGLSGPDERAERRVVHGLVEIIIVESDDGRLAAEFERLMREIARRRRARQSSRFSSAGQHELVD